MIDAYLIEENFMSKKILLSFISVLLCIFSLTGCNLSKNHQETYLSLMTVPSNAAVPDILTLVSILSVTNPDPANPEANLPPVLLGVLALVSVLFPMSIKLNRRDFIESHKIIISVGIIEYCFLAEWIYKKSQKKKIENLF